MYGFYGAARLVIIIVAVIIMIIALARWGADSLHYVFKGRKERNADEEKFRREFDNMQVTYPVAGVNVAVLEEDTFIDDLIAEGKFGEARAHVREMKLVAGEVGNRDAVRNYEAYERRITEREIKRGRSRG